MEDGTTYTGLLNVNPNMRKKGGRTVKIGPLKRGLMEKVGYHVTSRKMSRHRAINRAIRKYGRVSTLRKLNAVAVLTRRSSPKKSKKFRADVKYIQRQK